MLHSRSVESACLSDGRADVAEPLRARLGAGHACYSVTLTDQLSDEWLTDGSTCSGDKDSHAEYSRVRDAKSTRSLFHPTLKDGTQHS